MIGVRIEQVLYRFLTPDAGALRGRRRAGARAGGGDRRRRGDGPGHGDRPHAETSTAVTPAEQFELARRGNVVRVYPRTSCAASSASRPTAARQARRRPDGARHPPRATPSCLTKLRQFQDLGHQAILIIGDFTGADRRSRADARRRGRSSPRERGRGERGDLPGAGRSRSSTGDATEVRWNGEWFDRIPLRGRDPAGRADHRGAHARARRLRSAATASGAPIGIHEFLYPLMQGWDSVMRPRRRRARRDRPDLQSPGRPRPAERRRPGASRCAVIVPLLEGTDGTQKMRKVARQPHRRRRAAGGDLRQGDVDLRRADAALLRAPQRVDAEARAARRRGRAPPDGGQEEPGPELVARFHGAERGRRGRARSSSERFQQRARPNAPTPLTVRQPTPDVWICQLLKEHRLRRLHLGSAAAASRRAPCGRRRARRGRVSLRAGRRHRLRRGGSTAPGGRSRWSIPPAS